MRPRNWIFYFGMLFLAALAGCVHHHSHPPVGYGVHQCSVRYPEDNLIWETGKHRGNPVSGWLVPCEVLRDGEPT